MTVRRAGTVCVVRDGDGGLEVLLAERTKRAAFVPGAHVFPGGAVDALDEAWANRWGVDGSLLAAIRETHEEVGMLVGLEGVAADELDRTSPERFYAGLSARRARLRPGAMVQVSTWVTPPGPPRRFDTVFYVAEGDGVPDVDGEELVHADWFRPSDALESARAGQLTVISPTVAHLELLARFDTVEATLAGAGSAQYRPVVDQVAVEGYRWDGRA